MFSNEIFYTPNEELRSYPNSPSHRHFIKDSEFFGTNYMLDVFRQQSENTPTSNENVNEETDPNHVRDSNNEINDVHENDVEDARSLNVDTRSVDNVNSNNMNNLEAKSISHHKYEPEAIIKEDRMLIRVERLNHHETIRRYGGSFLRRHPPRKYLTHSLGWREYIVKLRSGIIELYENDVRYF